MNKINSQSIKESFKSIYQKLFKINDTPQKISLGLGLGVFAGILPGTGPIAALFLAYIFRVNRAAALLGSLLTNTWLSMVTFFLSIKVGSVIMKADWQEVYNNWIVFLKDFHWLDLFKISFIKIVLPVILGYLLVALFLGVTVYLTVFLALMRLKKEKP